MTDSRPLADVIEPPSGRILSTLNWLRAGVLGANDGIVSTAAIIFGVAGGCAPGGPSRPRLVSRTVS